MNLSDKRVLVYDLGIFSEVANRLGRDFGKVWYFTPWISAFPKVVPSLIGTGFENMERIRWFWDYVDKADLIVMPDTHCHDMYQFLKDKGYPVAGVGQSEEIELDRIKGRELQAEVGLPTQKTWVVTGIDNLCEFLKDADKVVIKLNTYRGDIETWMQDDFDDSEPKLARLKIEYGPKGDELEFIIEEKIEGIEPGIDGILYQGELLYPTMLGFELKGSGYISKLFSEESLPKPLKLVNDKLAPEFKKLDYNFWMSSEVIVTKKRVGYFIDPCLRLAAPVPNAVQQEIISNYSEIWWGMGYGEKVIPKFKARYGGGASFYSQFVEEGNWARVSFDEKIRNWIKFRESAKFKDNYWAVPKASTVCSIIAIGSSPEDVMGQIQERAKSVKAVGSSLDKSSADFVDLKDILKDASKYGISF